MDAGEIVALVFGVLAIVGTLVGCTWKLGVWMGGITTAVDANAEESAETNATIVAHLESCQASHTETETKLANDDRRIIALQGDVGKLQIE